MLNVVLNKMKEWGLPAKDSGKIDDNVEIDDNETNSIRLVSMDEMGVRINQYWILGMIMVDVSILMISIIPY